MGSPSHSVTRHPTQVNTLRLYPSQTGHYSIYLPRRDARLSWPKFPGREKRLQRPSSPGTDSLYLSTFRWQFAYLKSNRVFWEVIRRLYDSLFGQRISILIRFVFPCPGLWTPVDIDMFSLYEYSTDWLCSHSVIQSLRSRTVNVHCYCGIAWFEFLYYIVVSLQSAYV